jgi:hypothetical protein
MAVPAICGRSRANRLIWPLRIGRPPVLIAWVPNGDLQQIFLNPGIRLRRRFAGLQGDMNGIDTYGTVNSPTTRSY